MKKPKKQKKRSIDLHMYGIIDKQKNTMLKISLDLAEIQMEIALMGGLKGHLSECEFNIKLVL